MASPRKIRATVERIEDHGEDIYTLYLAPERRLPRFRAGQFLQLALDAYEPGLHWPESRPFSIASSTQSRDAVEIVYSVKGRFTARMRDELQEGSAVWMNGPLGSFILRNEVDKRTVLIAGGTGISPFVPFLQEQAESGSSQAIHLFYGVQSEALYLYRELIDLCRRRNEAFECTLWVERLDHPLKDALSVKHP